MSESASLVGQTVKNLLVAQEIQVRSLGQEDPWRREWLPTPEFFPGKFHGQRSLADYGAWGCKESDTTEHTHTHTFTIQIGVGT